MAVSLLRRAAACEHRDNRLDGRRLDPGRDGDTGVRERDFAGAGTCAAAASERVTRGRTGVRRNVRGELHLRNGRFRYLRACKRPDRGRPVGAGAHRDQRPAALAAPADYPVSWTVICEADASVIERRDGVAFADGPADFDPAIEPGAVEERDIDRLPQQPLQVLAGEVQAAAAQHRLADCKALADEVVERHAQRGEVAAMVGRCKLDHLARRRRVAARRGVKHFHLDQGHLARIRFRRIGSGSVEITVALNPAAGNQHRFVELLHGERCPFGDMDMEQTAGPAHRVSLTFLNHTKCSHLVFDRHTTSIMVRQVSRGLLEVMDCAGYPAVMSPAQWPGWTSAGGIRGVHDADRGRRLPRRRRQMLDRPALAEGTVETLNWRLARTEGTPCQLKAFSLYLLSA